jgi:predicted GNAT family acetyltransferase
MASADLQVRNNAESRSYDALIDDEVVGRIVYETQGERLILTHTVVESHHQGQGIAGRLVKGALDDIRADGRQITVFCDVVSAYLVKHPEEQDLVDPKHPGTFAPLASDK